MASLGGFTNTSLSMDFPWRKIVFIYREFNAQILAGISDTAILIPSREHVGLSILNVYSSSKPIAQGRALTDMIPSMSSGLTTQRSDRQV